MQVDNSFGSNRWDTAAFANADDKEKFSRLMVSDHTLTWRNLLQCVLLTHPQLHLTPVLQQESIQPAYCSLRSTLLVLYALTHVALLRVSLHCGKIQQRQEV